MFRVKSSVTSRFAGSGTTASMSMPVTDDFEFLNEARRRFHGERFESLYEAWRIGELKERDLRSGVFPTHARIELCSSIPFW